MVEIFLNFNTVCCHQLLLSKRGTPFTLDFSDKLLWKIRQGLIQTGSLLVSFTHTEIFKEIKKSSEKKCYFTKKKKNRLTVKVSDWRKNWEENSVVKVILLPPPSVLSTFDDIISCKMTLLQDIIGISQCLEILYSIFYKKWKNLNI